MDTDLKISGKLAQFGSGMIKEVSGKLLAQFVANLEAKLAADHPAPAAGTPRTPSPSRRRPRSSRDNFPPASESAVATTPPTAVRRAVTDRALTSSRRRPPLRRRHRRRSRRHCRGIGRRPPAAESPAPPTRAGRRPGGARPAQHRRRVGHQAPRTGASSVLSRSAR